MPNTTTIAQPLPFLGSADLNRLVRVLAPAAGPVAESVQLDARAQGVISGGVRVDVVHVRLADLEFAHRLDPTRFGSHDECEFCQRDAAAADAVREVDED